MNMTKKKVWMSFCIVIILLLTSTVLSIYVERMMRIEVETTAMIQNKGEDIGRIPLTCYQWDEYGSAFFYIKEREGLLGKELITVKKGNPPIYEEGDMAIIPPDAGLDENMEPLQIISWASWPIEEKDVVVLREKGELNARKQIGILACLVALLLPTILILSRSVKKLGELWEGNKKSGIEAIVMISLWLLCIRFLMGELNIPREYLPPDYILDFKFYAEEIKELNLLTVFRKELLISGGCILAFWSAVLFLYLRLKKTGVFW